MPLEKRRIEPCELSRKKLEDGLRNELEAVAVNTLCGIMRQLSGLSKHAEDVFGELCNEANGIYERTNSLHERVQNLSMKVTQLDSTVEEISLQEINMRKPFKSTIITDQQVLSSNTMPQAMIERYGQCDRSPRLSEMNPYRDDNKDALKFYTDPTYFFELWCEEMRKETEKKKKKKRGGRTRAGTREKKPVKAIKKKEYSSMGVEFQQTGSIRAQATSIEVSTNRDSVLPEYPKQANGDVQVGIPNHILPQHVKSGSPGSKRTSRRLPSNASGISRPSSAPPPPPVAAAKTASQYSDDFLPPPPEEYVPPPSLPPGMPVPPPPPPPPPMPGQMPRKPMPTSSDSGFSLSSDHTPQSTSMNSLTPSETSTGTADTGPADPKEEGRCDLLAAIRTGMELRKVLVQEAKKEEKRDDFAMDVASILARRIAVEYSSSEDESETGSEWDSEGDE